MSVKPVLAPTRASVVAAAAALSAMVAVGSLSLMTSAFQRAGLPFERIVKAEHVCAAHAYVSERERCVRQRLDESAQRDLARR